MDELNEQHKAVKAERAKLVARRATLEVTPGLPVCFIKRRRQPSAHQPSASIVYACQPLQPEGSP